MAKRGAPEHPKTLKLARKLGIEPWAAVGLLEVLWHWCSRYAISGLITASPEDLADGIRYSGDSTAMFNALCDCGLVDVVNGGYVIHNWSQHADDTVHSRLYRSVQLFADGTKPKPMKLGKEERAALELAWAALEDTVVEPESNLSGAEREPAGTPAASLPKPKPKPKPVPMPVPEPMPVPSGGNGDETTLQVLESILKEVPAFASSPPATRKLKEILSDYAILGEPAILRHARAARDWALDPKSRYAKNPNKDADASRFLRNWLERELLRHGGATNGSGLARATVNPWRPTQAELEMIAR